jgi:hypothetical protein
MERSMCDTFVALGGATGDGSVVFGKNSDREPNEAHELIVVPAAQQRRGSELRCTHISIPQVERTHRMLLAKPYWIWGAEMGANEHGVVIGNEALFNKGTREKTPGLIGMDLLRLGLERASEAAQAVAVITELLERHGQSGQAGHTHDFQYDNSFIVADPKQAWILETVGRDWVAREVRQSASISNGLTTRETWDLASARLGATPAGTDIARHYSEPVYTRFAEAQGRQCRTSDALRARAGSVGVVDAMTLLRDHGPAGDRESWTPARALTGQDVCMHAGFGPVRGSQSTGSLVVRLAAGGMTMWATGTAAPCTSTFKPIWLDTGLPDLGPPPAKRFDARTLWWKHELLHRTTLADYPRRMSRYRTDRDALQAELVAGTPDASAPSGERARFSRSAFHLVAESEHEWLARVRSGPSGGSLADRVVTLPYRRAWEGFNRDAGMPQL